jgi:hypothetical protein
LRRETVVPGIASNILADRTVRNQWICGTPRELRAKISDLCKSDAVRAKIVNLLTMAVPPSGIVPVEAEKSAGQDQG